MLYLPNNKKKLVIKLKKKVKPTSQINCRTDLDEISKRLIWEYSFYIKKYIKKYKSVYKRRSFAVTNKTTSYFAVS